MKTLQDEWNNFERCVVPDDAHIAQRTDMKRAFYAGAHKTLRLCLELPEDEEEAHKELDRLFDETEEFAKQVLEGKA